MPKLRDLQIYWQQYLLHQKTDALLATIALPPTNTAVDRIAIYADAYITRLAEVLEKNYPQLKQWLGDDAFDTVAENYLAKYPSRYASVSKVGKDLPQFLREQNQIVYAELAELEWAISAAIDTADAVPLDKSALEKIAPDQWANVYFQCHSSLQILDFTNNVTEIYQAITQNKLLPEIKTNQNTICRIWRKQLQVYYLMISSAEAVFLESIQQQKSFAEICEALCTVIPEEEVVSYAINQLLRWFDDNLLVGLAIKETA